MLGTIIILSVLITIMGLLNPLVTVLMPIYNGEKYLVEAIESVLNQTFTNFELLILNDDSPIFYLLRL